MATYEITDRIVGSMKIAKVHEGPMRINSMDFFRDGSVLATASDDETIMIYDCQTGSQMKPTPCKKYGCGLVRFTNHVNNILCASRNGWDNSIRYLSHYDRRYLHYYKGHRDTVTSLTMSPCTDLFISGSMDGTIRFWDLRGPACQGIMRRPGRPAVDIDPTGKVFATALSRNYVKLYDISNFSAGPFVDQQIEHVSELEFTSVKFSPSGNLILVMTSSALILILDAYKLTVKQRLTGHEQNNGTELVASFSPDEQYVLCGGEDGAINVWKVSDGSRIAVWKGHTGPVGVVQWSPTHMMVASGCSNLALWLPSNIPQ